MPLSINRNRNRFQSYDEEEEESGLVSEFSKGFGAGVDQLQALAGGAKALVGSAVGDDDWFYDGLSYYNEQMAEAAENAGDVTRIEEVDATNWASYVAYTVGNVAPSLIGAAVTGGIGGLAAKQITRKGVEASVKNFTENVVKKTANKTLAKKAGDDYRNKALAPLINAGRIAGAGAFSMTMESGSSFTRLMEEDGTEAPGIALATGVVSGGLDAIAPLKALKRVLPKNLYDKAKDGIGKEVAKNRKIYHRVASEAAKMAGIEGVTEATQEFIQNLAVGYVRSELNPDDEDAYYNALFDETAQSAYLNSFVAGALGGGSIGGVTGLARDPVTPGRPFTDEEQAQLDSYPVVPVADPPSEKQVRREERQKQRLDAQSTGPTIAPPTSAGLEQEGVRQRIRGEMDGREEQDRLGITPAEAQQRAQERLFPQANERRGQTQEEARERTREALDEQQDVFDDDPHDKPVLTRKDHIDNRVNRQDKDEARESAREQLDQIDGRDRPSLREDGETWDEARKRIGDRTRDQIDGVPEPVTPPEPSKVPQDLPSIRERVRQMTQEGLGQVPAETTTVGDQRIPFEQLPTSVKRQIIKQAKEEGLVVEDNVAPDTVAAALDQVPEGEKESAANEVDELSRITLTSDEESRRLKNPGKYDGPLTDPKKVSLAEAIQEVNKNLGGNRTPLSEEKLLSKSKIEEDTVSGGREDLKGDDSLGLSDEILHALVDLVGAGMPKSVLNAIPSIRVRNVYKGRGHASTEENSPASYQAVGGLLSIRRDYLRKAAVGLQEKMTIGRAHLRYIFSHELGHAYDAQQDISSQNRNWSVEFLDSPKGADGNIEFNLNVGSFVKELFQNFEQGTELGNELSYPFAEIYDRLNNPMMDGDDALRIARSESFAQSFAIFHSNPDILKSGAPKTYEYLRKLLREDQTNAQDNTQASPENTDTGGVLPEVQSQPQSGSSEVPDPGGTGGISGDGSVSGQTSGGMGEQTPAQDGVDTGQPVQEEVAPRVQQPQADPSKIRPIYGEFGAPLISGEFVVSYPDGDQRRLWLDPEEAKKVVDEMVQNESDPDYGLEEALPKHFSTAFALLKSKRQAEFDAWIESRDDSGEPFPKKFPDEEMDIHFDDLSPEGQKITSSPILYGDEVPDVTGTGVNGKINVADVGRALDARAQEVLNGGDLSEQTPENRAIISDMVSHEAALAMISTGNAGEWYQQKVANALAIAGEIFPELNDNAGARTAFTSILAVTSNGQAVSANSDITFRLYEEFRDTKRFPVFGTGKETQSMERGFTYLNDMLDKGMTLEQINTFLSTPYTVRELKQLGYPVNGELMDTQVYGSAILGPKIGQGFWQNLNGNYDTLTMDMWFMRMWGRLTGTLLKDAKTKLPVQIEKFRKTALKDEWRNKLRKDGISRTRLRKDDEYAEAYARQVQKVYADGKFKLKNTLNKASNTLVNSQKIQDAPRNGGDRNYMRGTFTDALDKLNEFYHNEYPINMGALQAIMWYPEKQLYAKMGAGNAKSEPTDYEAEFTRIAEGRGISGSRILELVGQQEPGSGGVQQDGVQASDTTVSGERAQNDGREGATVTLEYRTPEIEEIAEKVLSTPSSEVPTKEKIARAVDAAQPGEGWWSGFWQKQAQGIFDESNRIGYLEKQLNDGKLKDASSSGYKATLWSKNNETVMQAILYGGPVELKDGAFQLIEGEGSFYDIFEGFTESDLRQWELWAAANRAKRLKKEDRENLFDQADIDAVLAEARTSGQEELYQETLAKWIRFNRKILDLAEQTGTLNPERRRGWDHDDYVPFFRFEDEMEINDLQNDAVRNRQGLTNQGVKTKRLKGGEGKLNPLESMIGQLTTMIDRSFKNEAMTRIARDMSELGVMEEIPNTPANKALANENDTTIVKVFENGDVKLFAVHDPMLLRSIGSLGGYDISKISQITGKAKTVLTRGVTIDPGFMFFNAFRDIIAASMQFPNAPGPLDALAKATKYIARGVGEEIGMEKVDTEQKQNLLKIMASGGMAIGDYYGTGKADDIRAEIKRINGLDTTLNTPEKLEKFWGDYLDDGIQPLKTLWRKWNKAGQTFEHASRINVYEGARANGETHAEAVSQAADVLNFSMRGDYWVIRELVANFPFLNARLQGLNVLTRSLRDNTGHVLLSRGLPIAALSVALYMINKDRDEYEEMPDYDKDRNWHFYIGDEHYRLPKPFELGFAFATFPERVATYSMEDDKEFAPYFWETFKSGIFQTLGMQMMPQIMNPMVESYANYEQFRDKKIVGGALERAPAPEQYNLFTSDTAKYMAQSMPEFMPDMYRSPMKLEHMLNGYFASFSFFGQMVLDPITRDPSLPVMPSLSPSQYPVVKRFIRTDVRGTKYAEKFFDMRGDLDNIHRSYSALINEGKNKEAKEYLQENGGYVESRKDIARYYKKIKAVNNKIKLIYKDRKLSANQKRAALKAAYIERNALYKEAFKKHERAY